MLEVAGATVAATFVGATAACLAVTEVIRALTGGPTYDVIDLSLRDPDYIDAAQTKSPRELTSAFVPAEL